MGEQNSEQPPLQGPSSSSPPPPRSIPMVNTHHQHICPPKVTGPLPSPGNGVIPEGAGQVERRGLKGPGGQVFPAVPISH